MADTDESILTKPGNPEVARHVDDYSRFIFMFKWGAVVALIAAFLALFIIT